MVVDDLPGFGNGVEPVEDGFIILARFETPIELFADGMRETGDFSSSHNVLTLYVCFDVAWVAAKLQTCRAGAGSVHTTAPY